MASPVNRLASRLLALCLGPFACSLLAFGALASEPAAPGVAPAPSAPASPRRPDIILISFDTLRRDHVSCYGAERLTTPRIDALAASGVRFTDAQGVVPLTGPSHVTILTGLNPQEHGAFRNGVKVNPATITLPQLLATQGYETAAVVSGWTLKRSQVGLDACFKFYDDEGMEERYGVVNLMRRADKVTDAALAWADRQVAKTLPGTSRAPSFLFVHYFDPHEPYESPLTEAPGPNPAAGGFQRPLHVEALPAYDREIAFADRELGRLLDGFKTRGMLDDTVILVTADHGQSFGDHGYGGPEGAHGRRVYQDNVAVPFILFAPGRIPGGRSVDLPVSHLDILPTLATLGGVPESVMPPGLPGFSLAKVLADPASPPPWGKARRTRHGVTYRGAVGNKWNIFRWAMNKDVDAAEPLYAFGIQDGKKLIVDFTPRHSIEVYDLVKDPWESHPLAVEDVPGRDAWAQAVLDWYARTKSSDLRASQPTGAELENLRSLGYVE